MSLAITRTTISSEAVSRLLAGAVEASQSAGLAMCIAVTDESGVLKGFTRMDDAPLLSVDLAIDKAYTAAAFKMPTHAWFDFIKNDPPLLHGIVKTPRLIVFGGGYPVTIEEAIVGAIGVSGGHYSQDMKVAEAALAALRGG